MKERNHSNGPQIKAIPTPSSVPMFIDFIYQKIIPTIITYFLSQGVIWHKITYDYCYSSLQCLSQGVLWKMAVVGVIFCISEYICWLWLLLLLVGVIIFLAGYVDSNCLKFCLRWYPKCSQLWTPILTYLNNQPIIFFFFSKFCPLLWKYS